MKIHVVDINKLEGLALAAETAARKAPLHVSKESTYKAGYGNALIGVIGDLSFISHKVRKGEA